MRLMGGAFKGLVTAALFIAFVIAFFSIHQFTDSVVIWLGAMVGLDISIRVSMRVFILQLLQYYSISNIGALASFNRQF